MTIKIKRVTRIAVAVKDLNKAVEDWQRIFGIQPFSRGPQPDDRYEYVVFKVGEGECTMELLSPLNDPNGEGLIGKFIRERGEGLYMITFETEGTTDEVTAQFRETGLTPSWDQQGKEWLNGREWESWREHYVSPKDTHGVLVTLASVVYKKPEIEEWILGTTISYK